MIRYWKDWKVGAMPLAGPQRDDKQQVRSDEIVEQGSGLRNWDL